MSYIRHVPTPLRRNRDFVLLQLGQVFSNLGTTMHPTVLPFRTPDGTMAPAPAS